MQFRQRNTPKPIKIITIVIAACSLLSALTLGFLKGTPLQEYLCLSHFSMQHFSMLTSLTYLWVIPLYTPTISISYLITICMQVYMVWVLGSSFLHAFGKKKFYFLFFGTSILTGLFSYLLFIGGLSPTLIGGPRFVIFCFLISFLFQNGENRIPLFLRFTLKVKHLVLIMICVDLILGLSNLGIAYFLTSVFSLFVGYIVSLVMWERNSPFAGLQPLEDILIRTKRMMTKPFQTDATTSSFGKIFDIQTGKEIPSDEAFINACLEKISKHGKNSLSLFEKIKLRRLSRRKST